MKKKYFSILFFFLTPLLFNSIFAQCEEVTLESLSIPGPFSVAALDEEDGIRNGPDYNGATIYYPTNGTPPYASIAIVPGFTAAPSSCGAVGSFLCFARYCYHYYRNQFSDRFSGGESLCTPRCPRNHKARKYPICLPFSRRSKPRTISG